MAKLLTDDEVFGGASGALLSDEDVFGKQPERTALGSAGDIGVTALKGAVGLPQAAVGLLNILDTINRGTAPPGVREAAGDPTSRPGVAQALANAGLRFDDAQKALDTFYSPAQQAASRKVDEAKGFLPTAQAALENPSTIGHAALESIPQMLGGAAIGRAIASAAPRVAPWLAGALGEGAVGAGGAAEQIRNDPASGGELTLGQALMALGSGATTAAIGAAGGRLAQKLGLSDVDTMLVSGMTKLKTTPLGFARQVLGSGISEGVFEELPQSITEQMWQNWATGKPILEGVGKAGAMGMLTGAAMGAAGGGFNAAMAPRAGTETATGATPSVPGETKPATSGTLDPIPATEVLGDETAPAPRGTAPEPTDAEKALLKPRPLTALDRVQAIDRELGDSATTEEAAAALRAERADLVKDWPSATPGAPTSLTTEAGARVDAQYALMDIDALVTSHDADLRRNEAYPRELQPRERDRAASEMQVQAITQKLDPARLGASADAATGAPIVGADGLVESGNARTIAMKRVYQADGLVADEYRAWLRASAGQFGLTPEQIDGMAKPMLVRVRTTPVDRAEFARQANAPTVAAMSPVEQARSDANRIDAMDDLQPDDNGDFATSRDFIRRFVGRLPLTEQAGMLDAGGRLSSSGYARVRNAVLAKAYGDSPVLTRMVESMNDDMRNVSRALMIAAPRVAQARGAIAEGRRFDADITPHLVGAAEELSRLKERGTSVDDALAQSGLLGEEFSPETRELMRFIADNMRRPRRMAEFITGYFDALDAAGDPAQGSLLGAVEAPRTSDLMQVARRALEGTDGREATQDTSRGQPGGDRTPNAGQPADAPGDRRGAQGDDPAAGQDWVDFPESTGTLGIPRAEMPQIPGKDRGALVNFLEARGIAYERTEVAADSLRPTQREFSRKKVQQARQDTGAAKTVVVSGDGYVLDGHHRWMAQLVDGQPVDVMRFDAPIRELLAAVREFPGTKSAAPPTTPARDARAQALADFQDALADLSMLMSKYARANLIPDKDPDLMPTLVKLAGAAIRMVGTDLRRVVQWVRDALRRDPATKPHAAKVTPQQIRQAAEEAMRQRPAGAQTGLFDEQELEQQLDLFAQPKPRRTVVIDRTEHDLDAPNFGFEPWPQTLPAGHPLLRHTDTLKVTPDGKPRAEMRQKIVDLHFENAVAPQGRKPIAYVMGGGGASGKGTIKGLLTRSGDISTEGAVEIDPDRIKELVPEYGQIIKAGDSRAAATVHDESSDISKAVLRRATREKFDIVYDVTLGDPTKAAAQLRALKDAGYEVRLFGVTIDPRTALVRADGRARENWRYVPLAELLKAHRGFMAGFEQYAEIVDSVRLFDNTDSRVELAAKPLGGTLTLTDAEGYNSAVRRAGSINVNATTLAGVLGSQPEAGGAPGDRARPGGDGAPDQGRDLVVPVRAEPRGAGGDREANPRPAGTDAGRAEGARRGDAGLDDAARPGQDDRRGAQGPAPRSAGRRPGAAGPRAGGRDLFNSGDDGAGAAPGGEVGSPGADGVRGPDADGRGDGARSRNRRGAGTPAGRDIKPKSGLNFRFTDEDLSTAGSWFQKATRNVEAVELLRQLEKDGRQATPDEQRTLARFIGWGASDIANGLFSPERTKLAKVFEEYQRLRDRIEQEGLKEFGRSDRDYWTVYPKAAAAAGGRLGYGQPIPASVVTPESFGLKSEDVRWLGLRARLRAVLTDAEWAAAERTTQYAHYTSAPIVRAMWAAAQRFGFAGGAVLEPGAGNGMFPGLMPEGMATSSSYTGIEYDPITGGILKQLQPDEHILVESFIDTKLPRDFFDIAIGNPPFRQGAVLADPEYAKRAFSLHDYFFAKTLDRVKPGGLVMFVSSRFTMDKQNDKARQYLAERADLVGAIRLPQTAFKGNAGTEVVTDVLFLRKKVPGETFEQAQPWLRTVPVKVGDQMVPVNEYFAAHPEMILGKPALVRGMRQANEYSVLPPEGDIGELFGKAVQRLPENIYKAARGSAAEAAQVREIDFNPKAKKEGNYYVTDAGVLMQREGGVGMRVEGMTPKDQAIVKAFVPLRDALKQAHYDQLTDGDWESSLKALQAEYEKFTAAHGQVNQFVMRTVKVKVDELDEDGQPTGRRVTDEEERRSYPLLNLLRDDPDHSLVGALERVDDETGKITPSAFLTARVLGKPEPAKILTPHDALLRSLNDLGRVDIDAIAESLDLPPADAVEALGTAIYEDPSEGWQTADQYLSGNVKRKLRDARTAAKNDRRFERNVAALEAAQPAPKNQAQIDVSLGVNWVQGSDYARFLKEVAGVRANVQWNDATRQWSVDVISGHKTAAATVDWGTARRHAGEILEIALTGRPIRITDTVDAGGGSKKTVFNPTATEAANAALTKMREEFTRWVWTDEERASRLVTTYNDRFNTTVPRSFDGRHLTLPGTSKQFHIFDHVKRGAWRIIQSGNTYLAHAVGSGKTFQMVIAAMEQKRLGLVKKPMVVVPNHMLQQFAREWQELYPAARLMIADENNFHTENRRRFVSRVALSDLDGVIITHSAFKLLDLDPEFKAKIIQEQLDYMRAALEEAKEEGERTPRVKQIQARIETFEQKLQAALSSEGKDRNVRFDELGVDQLFVDEAHEFRKLDFATARQIKGIQPEGSDRAMDLYIKSRYLEEKHPGRSLVMASGTVITNTLAEMYTVQRFLGRKALEEAGIEDFDSWAAMFGREKTDLEPNAAGKYEPVTRFKKFVNVGELVQMFREFADVVTADQLAALLGDKRPKVEGGSRQIIVTPKVESYRAFQKQLEQRYEASKKWKPTKEEPHNPDPIVVIIGDGRLAAIDMRFVGGKNDPDSKLNRMIDDVIRTFKETADLEYHDKAGNVEPIKGATMMVFSDLGFGAGVAQSRGFNARQWFEKRLRDAGVPLDQVAFMGDYKKSTDKLKLFKDMNAGRKRILVGSSKNMGTGVNAQQRLHTMFHLDSPWFPADLEQREGRIVRQGNKNKLVHLRAYAAKGTYDEQMWKLLASKQHFIDQAMSGDPNLREVEDLDNVSLLDQAAALVAEDPRVMQLAGARADAARMERLQLAHEEQRMRFRAQFRNADATILHFEQRLADADKAAAKVQDLSGDKFKAKAGTQTYTERVKWGEMLLGIAKNLAAKQEPSQTIGEISGFPVRLVSNTKAGETYTWHVMLDTPVQTLLIDKASEPPIGIAMRAQNAVADTLRAPAAMREAIAQARAQQDAVRERLTAPFPMAGMLADKLREIRDLEAQLAAGPAGEALDEESAIGAAASGMVPPMVAEPGRAFGAQQTETPEFRRWFGDSKVVDAQGKPLVVYHGTAEDVTRFAVNRIGSKTDSGGWGEGFYFAADPGYASVYAGRQDGSNVIPAYVSLRNPLIVDVGQLGARATAVRSLGLSVPRGDPTAKWSADFTAAAKRDGHDGVMVTIGGSPAEVVAFRPEQIKSAIGNSGAFDPNDPSIVREAGTMDAEARRTRYRNDAQGDLFNQQLDLFLDSRPDESQAGPGTEEARRAAVEAVRVLRRDGTLLGRALASGLAERQRTNLVGQVAKTPEDLATLAQVYRDPRFETFRIIFTGKGSKVLAQVGLTTRLPGSTAAVVGDDLVAYVGNLVATAAAEGATGFYLLHNHPSGVATPSRADQDVTRFYAQTVGKSLAFKGHVVIDTNEFSVIEGSGQWEKKYKDFGAAAPFDSREHFAGHEITSSARAVELAKRLQVDDGAVSLIALTYQGQVKTITSLPAAAVEIDGMSADAMRAKAARVKVPLRRAALASTGARLIAVGRDETTMKRLHAFGLVDDAIVVKRSGQVESMADRLGRGGDALLPAHRRARVTADTSPAFDYLRAASMGEKRWRELAAAAETPAAYQTAPAPEQPKTARERADEIIARVARTPAPVDAAARLLTRITGTAWAASKAYDLGAKLLDRITPEAVKAGVVSDYGVPEAVIDQRAMMQGRQRQALRGAGALLEKLATLTRAESRIAYEWMNMDGSDPRAYLSMMQGLPEESVKVLQEVQQLIDSLSKEAVRLGQLEPEAFERHRFAYLRRSYAKHTAELTSGDKARRQRAISILGDQYKGRGMVQSVAMDRVKAVAPEWWQRKLVAGKADTALKGQRFERLERRAPAGAGTGALPGIGQRQEKQRVLEVHYWPAGEKKPAKYADWDNAGTWEVRDTKGPNLVMWRDFTKDERERMGEIDEARFAIAKTLQGMIHDVEVGRYLEYLAQRHAKADGDAVDGELVEASERYRDTFAPGTWVKVPDAKIPGTSVAKYGKLAGQYLPGPIWNDLRQVVNGKFKPFGEAYDEILRAWKISKTALSPAVHTNNIMSNVVMADWHGVSAGHVVKALGLVMAASDRRAANALGARDREAAREILARYQDSGGAIGGWVTQEIRDEQMAPILEALRRELVKADQGQAEIGVYAAMQHMLHARFPAALEALRGSTSAAKAKAAAGVLIDLYQAEDDVFRLAAWLKAKEEGATDPDAGKVARRSFLDYSINAPWIQAMRSTAFPFISFTYRAVPMLLETAGKNPHKLLKLMALAGGLNALGVMLGGGGGDDERKLLPEEKAGRIWGMVPKLIRMPWNDAHGSPVYLDIRRWIPVGDVVDVAQGHAAVPLLPAMYPGGPMAVLGEVVVNKSMFTGKPITLETDTGIEKARKVTDHLWKAFAPNLLGLPGTYATTGVVESFEGRTDKFGREMSTAQALASSVGVKLGSYPADVLRNNLMAKQRAELAEIDRVVGELKRQRQTNRISAEEFEKGMQQQQAKKLKLRTELAEKVQ